MLQDEQISGAQAEHDERVPVDAVTQPPPSRTRQVLMHGQRVDVADPTAIEVARCRVVKGVFASPKIVRRERQHTDHASDPVVRERRWKKAP